MDRPQGVFLATLVLIVGVVIASGPLVGVSFTTAAQEFEPSEGTIEATVVSTPDVATLEATRYGVDQYYLRADSAHLQIDEIEGQPTVVYEIYIPAMGYTRSSVVFLDESFEGDYELAFGDAKLEGDRIDQSEYEGELRILHEDSEYVLFEKNISIEVQE